MSSVAEEKPVWAQVAKRLYQDVRHKDLTGHAQRIAYNVLFSIGPLLIFLTAFAGFIVQQANADVPNPVQPVVDWLRDNLPSSAADFLEQPVQQALDTDPGFLISFGGIFALWGAKNAIGAIMTGLNTAYGVEERRSWPVRTGIAIALTMGLALSLVMASGAFLLGTDLGQTVADEVGLGSEFATLSRWLRWPLVTCLVVAIIVLLHRYAPNLRAPLRWYLPGATFTVVATILATAALRYYLSMSTSFEAYGVFGAVLAFIFFLYVISLVILMGGVVNSAIQDVVPSARHAIESKGQPRPAEQQPARNPG